MTEIEDRELTTPLGKSTEKVKEIRDETEEKARRIVQQIKI
ncbi:MAG TPA: hypothetical protein VEH58_00185 [Dehalococcoidales bacterium]|nr:hypothetical protein [Dehalococcoidales bacterium]